MFARKRPGARVQVDATPLHFLYSRVLLTYLKEPLSRESLSYLLSMTEYLFFFLGLHRFFTRLSILEIDIRGIGERVKYLAAVKDKLEVGTTLAEVLISPKDRCMHAFLKGDLETSLSRGTYLKRCIASIHPFQIRFPRSGSSVISD